jgi:hypothetical protein
MGCRHSKYAPLEARPIVQHMGMPQLRTGDCMLLGEPGAWTHVGVVFELPQIFLNKGSPLLFEYVAEQTDDVVDVLTGSSKSGLRLVNLQQRLDSMPPGTLVTFALLQSCKTPAARRNRGVSMWAGGGVFEFELIRGAPQTPSNAFEAALNIMRLLGIVRKEAVQHTTDIDRWLSTPFLNSEQWYLERTLLRYCRDIAE